MDPSVRGCGSQQAGLDPRSRHGCHHPVREGERRPLHGADVVAAGRRALVVGVEEIEGDSLPVDQHRAQASYVADFHLVGGLRARAPVGRCRRARTPPTPTACTRRDAAAATTTVTMASRRATAGRARPGEPGSRSRPTVRRPRAGERDRGRCPDANRRPTSGRRFRPRPRCGRSSGPTGCRAPVSRSRDFAPADRPGPLRRHRLDDQGSERSSQLFEMGAPPRAAEPLLHLARVAPGDAEPGQSGEGRRRSPGTRHGGTCASPRWPR